MHGRRPKGRERENDKRMKCQKIRHAHFDFPPSLSKACHAGYTTTPDLDEALNHITEQLPLSCFSAVNLNAF